MSDAQFRTGTASIGLTVLAIVPIGTVNGPVLDTDNGTAHVSPYAGQTVTVQGVIYEKTLQATSGTSTYKGFFVQNTSATEDADPNTSDGLFVFMGTTSTIVARRAVHPRRSGTRSSSRHGHRVLQHDGAGEPAHGSSRWSAPASTLTPRSRRSWRIHRSPSPTPTATGNGSRACACRSPRTASCSAGATCSARPTPRSGWPPRTARSRSGPTRTHGGRFATPIRSTTTTTRRTGTATATAS